MSKAFTKESDDGPEPLGPVAASALPPGAKNYITPDGERRMRETLEHLRDVERPALAGRSDPDAREPLRQVDRRIQQLQAVLASVEVVPPPASGEGRVRFGSWVEVLEPDGATARYQIVGVEEVDFERGCVSWLSPLARALLNKRAGEACQVRRPDGPQTLRILRVL